MQQQRFDRWVRTRIPSSRVGLPPISARGTKATPSFLRKRNDFRSTVAGAAMLAAHTAAAQDHRFEADPIVTVRENFVACDVLSQLQRVMDNPRFLLTGECEPLSAGRRVRQNFLVCPLARRDRVRRIDTRHMARGLRPCRLSRPAFFASVREPPTPLLATRLRLRHSLGPRAQRWEWPLEYIHEVVPAYQSRSDRISAANEDDRCVTEVAPRAARAAALLTTITATCRRTRSAAKSGSRFS
jgi:hypothetical protein